MGIIGRNDECMSDTGKSIIRSYNTLDEMITHASDLLYILSPLFYCVFSAIKSISRPPGTHNHPYLLTILHLIQGQGHYSALDSTDIEWL